jgi:hypothetical protein
MESIPMKSGSNVYPNNNVSRKRRFPIKVIRKQHLTPGGTAYSMGQFSYWLLAMTLGLASSSLAIAADDDQIGIATLDSVKSEITKTPKPYLSDFLVFPPGNNSEALQAQPPTVNPSPGFPAMLPEASPAQDENLVTDAADLRSEIPEVSVSAPSPGHVLLPEATGPEIGFGLPGSAALDEISIVEPTISFLGNSSVAGTASDAAFDQISLIAQTADSTDDIPWRFSFEPFFYLPFGANGDITVRGINAPINAGIAIFSI